MKIIKKNIPSLIVIIASLALVALLIGCQSKPSSADQEVAKAYELYHNQNSDIYP